VYAQTAPAKDPAATPGIDKRQAEQQKRIDQGVKSGELTAKEAARMEKGQERVQKMEDKAKADGKVTAKERARINQAQDVQSATWPRKSMTASTTATMTASGIGRAASKSTSESVKPAWCGLFFLRAACDGLHPPVARWVSFA
jgi:polyhydroxyalkanoate synthesis regulator phasin